jgi:hypothetical protein
MRETEQIDRVALAVREFSGARLGDARLERRLGLIAEALTRRSDESLPNAMGDSAALEATYRFLGNERVCAEEILRPHRTCTRERCKQAGRVLAVFDTSELRFPGDREQLGRLQHGGRGMLAHVGFAVSADGRRDPLGVLHLETLLRPMEKRNRKSGAAGHSDNERLRWHRGVQAVFKEAPDAVCVMDREADVFDLAFEMSQRKQLFIMRAAQNRATAEGLLWDLLDDMEHVSTRVVKLTARAERTRKAERARHAARSEHTATLELRVRSVMVHEPRAVQGSKKRPVRSLKLNLVHVIEREPPNGENPVEWKLLTNLDVASAEDVGFVVDSYCARWVIEEFFKALKSGCALEKRQLESVASITNMLAISLPIAWLLLRIRNLSRDEPDRPAAAMLSPLMLKCLRTLSIKRRRYVLPDAPTCRELTWAIAGLGGHIKNNGEPGFIVLGRGLDELLTATQLATDLGLEM